MQDPYPTRPKPSDNPTERPAAPPPVNLHVHNHAAPEQPPHPVVKGCAITWISLMLLWILPVFLIFSGILATVFRVSFIGLFALLPVFIAIFAIFKIATAGKSRATPVQAVPDQPRHQRTDQPLTPDEKQANLFQSLPETLQRRHKNLVTKISQLKRLATNVEDFETKAQLGPGLEKLQWLHLKSLLARDHLSTHTPEGLEADLTAKIEGLRATLNEPDLSPNARRSKQSTLEMTEERLRSLENRRCRIEEIDSDLERIEVQLDLSLERAALFSSEEGNPLQLDLAERMVDTADYFGSSLPLVKDIDQHFDSDSPPERE